jgi:hypothetical protein
MTEKIKYNHDLLTTFCSDNHITLLSDYSNQKITRETRIEGKCLTDGCENTFEKSFRSLHSVNGYCNECLKECSKEKMKATNLTKYGSEYSSQSKEVREKKEATNLKKYGVKHPSQSTEVREKKEATNLAKYGVKHSLQSTEVREKAKKTCLAKLGVEYPAQSQVIRDKMNETYFKNHWARMNSPDKTYEYIMKENGDIWMVLKNDPLAEPEMIIERAH